TEKGDEFWCFGKQSVPVLKSPYCKFYFLTSKLKRQDICGNVTSIPKPTDINLFERTIKTATLKEHPYSSHISRFAMFPSFLSPDDPERGVRAASQRFINPLVPNKPPDVSLLSKTIATGGPYRHEILENPVKSRKMAVSWTGENGFLDHSKPVKGETQIFYPAPPKTILPNPKLRQWDLSLSERTSNILRNLERELWITSYQMDFTGSGPANPLKTDDFKEKISTLTGINSRSAPLRESSCPVFVPSKPKAGRRQRLQTKRSDSPNFAGLQMSNVNQSTAPSYIYQKQPQELMATYNKERAVDHGRERENRKIRFDESLMQESESKSNEGTTVHLSNTQCNLSGESSFQREAKVKMETNSTELQKEDPQIKKQPLRVGYPLGSELHDALSNKEDKKTKGSGLRSSRPNVSILPRRSVFSGTEAAGRTGTTLTLLDLQNSFSKSEAHRRFNNSITHAAVDLRDNVVTGKRHNFYGINCNHIHG
uniref:Sperm microtubule inner protein 4 n=1 Tax=Poecilia formosa TaxID=48698 RepID=A0A087XBG2_POEFO